MQRYGQAGTEEERGRSRSFMGFGGNRRHRRFRLPWQKKVRRDVKDRLFRFLFEHDKEALLQLYNALNGTDYSDASELQVVTIDSAVYVTMKNDLAFVLAGTLNLYEHQSTYSPNLSVRFLIYLAEEYQKLIERAEVSLYGPVRIMLPTPQCVVFYIGEHDILYETLREHRAEVLGMLLEEFDVDKYEKTLRTEGIEIGRQMTLVKNVERIMRKFHVTLPEACEALEISVAEYENAKKQTELMS